MYILDSNVWYISLIRDFCIFLDKIIYGWIPTIYNFLIEIARTSILSQSDILDMADRIYKLLAVFMIFKVTFSLIMYVVNPDDFTDKSKGVSKLITNIIISLALLILTPYIFNQAYELQTIILEDNALATLIFGGNADDSVLDDGGDLIAYDVMQAFFVPDTSVVGPACAKLTTTKILEDANGEKHKEKIINEDCFGLKSEKETGEFSTINKNGTLYDATYDSGKATSTLYLTQLQMYASGVEYSNFNELFRSPIAKATLDNEYVIDYSGFLSTAVGIITLLLLVTFCMDVALRSVKLAFLQLIAPIPIISLVDPKSGKDGMFKKWYQMCFSTYLSVFIRLLALYFGIYIISKVDNMVDIIDGSIKTQWTLKIFVIIGILMFVKQLPKILEGLGIKLDGDGKFTLNPFKRMGNEMLGGGLVNKAATKVGKGIGDIGKGVGKLAGRTAKGLGTMAGVGAAGLLTGRGLYGTGKGMRNAFKGALNGDKFGKNFSNSYKAAQEGKKERRQMAADGVKPSDVRKQKWDQMIHGRTNADKVKQIKDRSDAVQSKYDTIKNQAVACDSNDSVTRTRTGADGRTRTIKSAKTISKELDEMKKTQISRDSFHDIEGKTAQQQLDESVGARNAEIANLQVRKAEYQDKSSKINMELAQTKQSMANLNRDDFANENDYWEARAACQQRIAVLENEQQSYDVSQIDQEIADKTAERDSLDISQFEDIEGKSADEQYTEAIEAQKNAIKEKEADLEYRINALANGDVKTDVESANKVIEEAAREMRALIVDEKEGINAIGRDVAGDNFKGIKTEEFNGSGTVDYVKLMKNSKGTAAQTTTGDLEHATDISKYVNKK